MFKNPLYCKTKRVVVLDLDHTIIGEASILAQIELSVEGLHWKPGHQPPPLSEAEIIEQFKQGLLRPDFPEFIQRVRERDGHLVVVYTAAIKKWADKILLALNTYLGYQFYCLLLTRQYCIPPNSDKSLLTVQDVLKQMSIIRKPEDFVMIDNNMVMRDTRLILAPDYLWTPEINLFKRLNGNEILNVKDKNYLLFMDIQYLNKAQFLRNKEFIRDSFFKTLII